jgi:hypothetical protein
LKLAAAALSLALVACSASDPVGVVLPPSGGGENPDRVPLAEWTPLPAADALAVSPAAQAARDEILGPNATDPAQVKLWWYGVSSFIASMGGHLFLFDAWEIVGAHEDYVPIGREELAAIEPEVIFIGHGHFDHAADAGYVAGRSGAVVVGSEEICGVAKDDAAAEGNAANFQCLITGTMDAPLPGTIQSVKLWADLPEVSVLQHVHSAATPEPEDPGVPFIHIPNLLPYLINLNTDPSEIARFVSTLDDPQGGTWAYHLRLRDFSLLWHDSAGPINLPQDYAAEVQSALDRFPDCVDVHVGAIVGFNQPLNGLRDPRLYVEHSHPKVSLPSHHDAWAPVVGGGAASYEAQWRAEIATLEHPPELDYLRDPQDYLVARVYAVDDPRWIPPTPGSSCAEAN